MRTILGLSYIAVLPVAATVILYVLNKKTSFGRLNEKTKQVIYGLIFGGLAVVGNEFGVDLGGALANTRDASVLTAGLVFGAPAGIVSGIIGGVERYLCVYWGGAAYTQLACSLSTVIAGFLGAVLRKYMFDGKKPSSIYALSVGLVAEVMHMLMIFVTNMSDVATAFIYVKECSVPMITVNGLAVMLSVMAANLFEKEDTYFKKRDRRIATVAQRRLMTSVVAAFVVSCLFTAVLQIQISDNDTSEVLGLNIQDVVADITDASNKNLLALTQKTANEIKKGRSISEIASEYQIAEINIVDGDGIIIDSTNPDFLGYRMTDGLQSAEFMVLLRGKTSFVQSYQPISYDTSIWRKYAGVALDSGFVQVGYDALHFQQDIAREVMGATVNRHVGKNGYLLIADKEGLIVSGPHTGKNIKDSGIEDIIADPSMNGICFTAHIFGQSSRCMYQFKEGYYGIAVLPESEAVFSRDISIYMMVFMEIVIFVGLFILIFFLIKRLVVDNIKSVNGSLSKITGGDLNVTVDVRSNEEFSALSDDINATVGTLKRLIAEEAARIDRELELAKVIQESSLPTRFPPFPEIRQLDIFASMDAAKEVGGDFYDFYMPDDSHLVFLVADVSGKGITGAMFMMKAKALIKGFAEHSADAGDILTRTNNALCEGNDAEMFVTCFLGILDLKNNRLQFANAGHNPPLIKRKDGHFEYFRARPCFVLGGMENIQYRSGETEFSAGDKIFLYTDGVTEAENTDQGLYGEERLYKLLNSRQWQCARDLCLGVKADVDLFVGEASQFDDITMLCIGLDTDKTEKSKTEMGEIVVEATIRSTKTVTDFVNSHLEKLNCPEKARRQINVAIDELFGNIAQYAYHPEMGEVTVRVEVEDDPLSVVITFMDGGVPFDPLQKPDPDISLSAEQREVGGLGIFLVKKSMDDIAYEYKNGHNILKIKKNIQELSA